MIRSLMKSEWSWRPGKTFTADRKVEVSDIIKLCSADEELLADPQKRENLRTALLAIAGVRGRLTENDLAIGWSTIETQRWMDQPSSW